jgi:hypothetical protein
MSEFMIQVNNAEFAYVVQEALRRLGIETTDTGFNFVTGQRELYYQAFEVPQEYIPQYLEAAA